MAITATGSVCGSRRQTDRRGGRRPDSAGAAWYVAVAVVIRAACAIAATLFSPLRPS